VRLWRLKRPSSLSAYQTTAPNCTQHPPWISTHCCRRRTRLRAPQRPSPPYYPVAVTTPIPRQTYTAPDALANTLGSESADQILSTAAPDASAACAISRLRPHRERRKSSTQFNRHAATDSIPSRRAHDSAESHVPANFDTGYGYTGR
jgi:hypothetical protein